MKVLMIWWHEFVLAMHEEELYERTRSGSAGSLWAADVMRMNAWRRREIKRLRDSSWLLARLRRYAATR